MLLEMRSLKLRKRQEKELHSKIPSIKMCILKPTYGWEDI